MKKRYFLINPDAPEIQFFEHQIDLYQACNDLIKTFHVDGIWRPDVEGIMCGVISHTAKPFEYMPVGGESYIGYLMRETHRVKPIDQNQYEMGGGDDYLN